MNILKRYGSLIEELYNLSNPIIKFKIDKELREKNVAMAHDIVTNNNLISYWLNIYDGIEIHGSKDSAYENSIAKLLEFGLTRESKEFNRCFSVLLEDKYWEEELTFYAMLIKTVLYPFLIRAGYMESKNVSNFFINRLETIEKTIKKYGYEFKDTDIEKHKKYRNEFVFKIDVATEWLPTIYDLYAFAFYPRENDNISKRLNKIVEYLLNDAFQNIPKKAYIYDITKKRYYAAGNVYHACMKEDRRLLTIYLLSHFKVVGESSLFINELKKLLSYQSKDGFYEFDKSLIKEKKNSNFIYTGCHMGLGEKRTHKNWGKIESTFWMLKILSNLEKNNIIID